MREKDIKNIKEKLQSISNNMNLIKDAPGYYPNVDYRVEAIINRLSDEEPPIILWNIQPWDSFNILHGIYCQKLKECIDLGFNVIVLFYDKLVEKLMEKKTALPRFDPNYVKTNVENNIKWFKRSGLKEEKTEFLTETILWKIIDPADFMETTTSLAHKCHIDEEWINREDLASFIMDNLCEIYYENIINCDILLTGNVDIQRIWNMIRGEMVIRDKRYEPPVILSFLTLNGIDGKPLTTYSDQNSLSINHKTDELEERIKNSSQDFLETLFEFLIIPREGKITKVEGESVASFQDLKKRTTIEKIRNKAFEFIKEYFNEIKVGP